MNNEWTSLEVMASWFMLCSNGVEEPMEEPAQEPEPEPEPEPKVEEIKPEADEKVLEEMEEKAPSPAPVESPPNTQEPPKVRLMCLCCVLILYLMMWGVISWLNLSPLFWYVKYAYVQYAT